MVIIVQYENIEQVLSLIIDFSIIFIFSITGAYVNDTYKTLTGKESKVMVKRMVISAIVSSIILFSFSDAILSRISWKMFILPCFIGGMIGFELLGEISNLSFWKKVLKNINNVYRVIKSADVLASQLENEKEQEDGNDSSNNDNERHKRDRD